MKAIRFHEYGGPEVLRYEEAPAPVPRPGEACVRLHAAALNHLDIWVRKGAREKNTSFPHIPGSDGAGVVESIGAGVGQWKAGDRVLISPGLSCGHCRMCLSGRDNLCPEYRVLGTREHGTCAEYVCVPAVNLQPIPDGLDFNQAAAVPLVFLTAWHMLLSLAKLTAGETVLVHGAGSGVGTAAIQISRLIGARIITTAGSDEKLALASKLGAHYCINYTTSDFSEEVKRLTEKRGVDVVFEHIGGDVLRASIPLLARGGRLVTCGATTGYTIPMDIRYIFARHLSIFGSWMGGKAELADVLKFFLPSAGDRKLVPVIDSVLPLSDCAGAHRRLEERNHFGKVVLSIP
jgi:NADPH:quinone reductase-like Zn-dependent oxidoreductase